MKVLSGEWLVSEASEGGCETSRRSSERYRLWRGFGPSTAHVRSSERTSPASSEVEHRLIGGRRSLTRNQRGRQRGMVAMERRRDSLPCGLLRWIPSWGRGAWLSE